MKIPKICVGYSLGGFAGLSSHFKNLIDFDAFILISPAIFFDKKEYGFVLKLAKFLNKITSKIGVANLRGDKKA